MGGLSSAHAFAQEEFIVEIHKASTRRSTTFSRLPKASTAMKDSKQAARRGQQPPDRRATLSSSDTTLDD
jgi:hypothetical protein